jgi:hypothetical protein
MIGSPGQGNRPSHRQSRLCQASGDSGLFSDYRQAAEFWRTGKGRKKRLVEVDGGVLGAEAGKVSGVILCASLERKR